VVGQFFLGNFAAGMLTAQQLLAPMVAGGIGLRGIPATTVEGACASGGIAFHRAVEAVTAGQCDIAMAIGAEKMSSMPTAEVTNVLVSAMDKSSLEPLTGLTFAGFFALLGRKHMLDYGTTLEQMSAVALKNRDNAQKNPLAHFFGKPATLEQINSSRMVADPFRLFDCSPISDGAAAVIVASETVAHRLSRLPIRVAASVQSSGPTTLQEMRTLTSLESARLAATTAYGQARVAASNIDIAEVHDCFTSAEIIAMEDLQFCQEGEGGGFVASGATCVDGSLPVNVSGGLLSKGHPVGATGLAQVFEIVRQLRGDADQQVSGARIGLTHNVGGTGGSVVINILSAD
jgi:acetyl-CoA C-acetyltransferase